MSIRSDLRKETAGRLNTLSKEDLQKLRISRVSEITWLDRIGIPIWKATVPVANMISVTSGKSLDRMLSRAGAIAEAIEFGALEGFSGPYIIQNYRQMTANRVPDFSILPFAVSAQFNLDTFTSWETMAHLFSQEQYYLPSDSIYVRNRMPYRWRYFMTGSNGTAAAGSIEEALCVALYELVERDAWTLSNLSQGVLGVLPHKIDLEDAPEPIADAVDRITCAGSKVMLYDVTNDIGIRVFGACLYDTDNPEVGIFAGYGCSCDPIEAALRAILEACQSRLCYIDGARDDFARRAFYSIKNVNHRKLFSDAQEAPYDGEIKAYAPLEFDSVEKELEWIQTKLRARGLTNLFWKPIWSGHIHRQPFHVVKAVSLDLETYMDHLWRPKARALELLAKTQTKGNAKTADNGG